MGTLLCPPFGCGLLDYCCTSPSAAVADESTAVPPAHRNVFRESLKSLEADIMHANTLLSGEMLRDSEGASLQMRLTFSPLAPLLLFLVQWADCSLAGALGLLRVLVYRVYRNGRSTAHICERRATIRQFSGLLFPALQQIYPGISASEFKEQQRQCQERYLGQRKAPFVSCACGAHLSSNGRGASNSDDMAARGDRREDKVRGCGGVLESTPRGDRREDKASRCGGVVASTEWRGCCAAGRPWGGEEVDAGCSMACMIERERERECGICLEERKTKVALPSCGHCLCQNCFRDWNARSKSCPFCRRGLTRVDSGDLWELVERGEAEDLGRITRDNIRRFFIFVHRLPLEFPDTLVEVTPSERLPLM